MEEEEKYSPQMQRTSSLINNILTSNRFSDSDSPQTGFYRVLSESEKFEDLEFKPGFSSLIRDPSKTKLDVTTVKKWREIEWKRASEFMEKGFKIFDEVPKVEDIS